MKIVIVGPFGLSVKSTMRERALPMARALVKQGHEVTMLLPAWDSPEQAGYNWEDEEVRVVNIPLPIWGPHYHLWITISLTRRALALKPDVIHLFKPKAYSGLVHTLLYMLRKINVHQTRLVVDSDDWEQAWNKIGEYTILQKYFFSWQEPWGLTHADSITVASIALRDIITEELNLPVDNIYYLPNGLRHIQQKNEEYNGKDIRALHQLGDGPVVLLYTRFYEFKLSFLFEVMQAVDEQLPATRWLIVGKGYFDEEIKLAEMVQSTPLAKKCDFTGWVPKADLPHYFTAANVALYPYADTLINRTKCSVKLLDLLSAGVPVVASAVGQNTAYIRHAETGFLPEVAEPKAMADYIAQILQDTDLQVQLGQAAKAYVKRKFSWESLVKTVEKAYGFKSYTLPKQKD